MEHLSRRRVIHTGLIAGGAALAGCIGDDGDDDPADDADDSDDVDDTEPDVIDYEIWALDQGTDNIYVYSPSDHAEAEYDLIEEVDLHEYDDVEPNEDGNVTPHMIAYSSDYAYAAVACTNGAQTLIFRTEDYELVAALNTGPGSHFAGFTPDDDAIIVDVIGDSTILRVEADLDDESFDIDDEIVVNEDIEGLTDQEGAPICHSYDHDGRSYHTLGPGYPNAGLVVVDHDDFSVERAYPGEKLSTNCGTVPHPTDDKFYLTAGMPTPTDDDGEPIEDEEGVGAYYVLDTAEDEILVDGVDTGGIDAHGFWFTPDGEELWVLNRETNDGVIVDPETDDVIEEIDAYGPDDGDEPGERDAPDIMWAEPNGEFLFVTLRGPNPLSGDPHAATGVTPGFSIIDIANRDIVDVVEPDADNDASDFHGIGVRPIGDVGDLHTSPPY